jgi:hypothetical protein
MLKVEFEMEDGAPDNLAEIRLGTAVGEFQRIIETGVIGAGTGDKTGANETSGSLPKRRSASPCLALLAWEAVGGLGEVPERLRRP